MLDTNFELLLKKALNGNSPIPPTVSLVSKVNIEETVEYYKMLRRVENVSSGQLEYTTRCTADGMERALKMLGITP